MNNRFPSHLESCDVNNLAHKMINQESKIKLSDNKITSHKHKCGKLLQARPYAYLYG